MHVHAWVSNILVANNKWCQVTQVAFKQLHQLQLAFVSSLSTSVLDDDVNFKSSSWHFLYPFTKFTDQCIE